MRTIQLPMVESVPRLKLFMVDFSYFVYRAIAVWKNVRNCPTSRYKRQVRQLQYTKDVGWQGLNPLIDSSQGTLHTETSILRIKRPWRVKIRPTTDIFAVYLVPGNWYQVTRFPFFAYVFAFFPFGRSPFSVFPSPFRFVVFRLCLIPRIIAFFAFIALFSLPRSPWCRVLFSCLGDTPPPRAACEPASLRVPPLCARIFMRSCFLFFSSLFWLSIWRSFVSSCVFPCGYFAVSSVSVSVATRLVYDMYLIRTSKYIRTLISTFKLVWDIRFVLVVLSSH